MHAGNSNPPPNLVDGNHVVGCNSKDGGIVLVELNNVQVDLLCGLLISLHVQHDALLRPAAAKWSWPRITVNARVCVCVCVCVCLSSESNQWGLIGA